MQINRLTIVKVGGAVVEEPESLSSLLRDFAALAGHKALVHGGGRSASRLQEALGQQPQMIDGRRVTDLDTLKVVTMVYAGLVNKTIVAHLQGLGINALGLTGADMDLMRSRRRPPEPVDYGFVGDPEAVDATVIADLIDRAVVPVVAPITHDGHGQLLNTNADTMAAALAGALACQADVRLLFCFEKPGVLLDPNNEDSYVDSLDLATFNDLRQKGVISGGMVPKLQNGFDALKRGVAMVAITNTDGLRTGRGTILSL